MYRNFYKFKLELKTISYRRMNHLKQLKADKNNLNLKPKKFFLINVSWIEQVWEGNEEEFHACCFICLLSFLRKQKIENLFPDFLQHLSCNCKLCNNVNFVLCWYHNLLHYYEDGSLGLFVVLAVKGQFHIKLALKSFYYPVYCSYAYKTKKNTISPHGIK